MANQDLPATPTGATTSVLMDLAVEVKIPINTCFISLGVPYNFFKMNSSAQSQALKAAQAKLQAEEQTPTFASDAVRERALKFSLQTEMAKLARPLRPQLFLAETYRLTTIRTGEGKGTTVGTIVFLADEEKTLETRTSVTDTTDLTKSTTAMESQDTTVAQDFNHHVAQSSAESGGTDASDYHMDANFHGDASIGFDSGEVNAQLGVKGGSNDVRSDFSKAVGGAMDTQIAQTSASRQTSVSEARSDTSQTSQTVNVSTSKVKNPNPTHTVTFLFFQLLERYTSFLSFVDI